MKPRPRLIRPLLQPIALCIAMALHAHASSAPADTPRDLDALMLSPDGDPAVFRGTFRAEQFPLLHRGPDAPPTPDGTMETDFVSNGIPPEGDLPSGVAFTPDGTKIVVAHRDTRNLVVFDAATRSVLDEIPLSGSPNDVAISPDGTRAVTPNIFEDAVSIVNLATGAEIAVIPVGDQPGVVRISPNGAVAAVGNTVSGSVSVIDIATSVELRRITGIGFVGLNVISFETGVVTASFNAFEFAGNTKLVHADYYGNRIQIIETSTGAVTNLASSNTPRGVAVTPNGAKAVVTNTGSVQLLSVVDPAIPSIVKTIACGADLDGPVTIDPTGTKAVVAVLNACRVVNLNTNAVSPSLATASVRELRTTADGLYALCVGFSGSLIAYSTSTIVNTLNNVVSTEIGAVSPTGPRAVMVASVLGEEMLVVNTNGVVGFLEGIVPSGAPPEGDKARSVALRPGSGEAVVVNVLSDNVSILNLFTNETDAVVAVGNRPTEVEITENQTKAVVANLDSDFLSVIDLETRSASSVPISTRAAAVEISPDGQYAYVAVVTNDGVWRVDLASLAVVGPKLATGNMGGIGYSFSQNSGMTLSHDGATLITCNSFDNTISIIDTATWAVVRTLAVSSFPVRAVFSPDDSRIYVANKNDDTVKEVTNAGASSTVIGSVVVGDAPFEMAIAPDGARLYAGDHDSETISVIDLGDDVVTGTIPLPDPPLGLAIDEVGEFLYAATGTWSVSFGPGPIFSIGKSGQISMIALDTETIAEQADTGLPPTMIELDTMSMAARLGAAALAAVPSPFGDGVTLANFVPTGIDESPAATGIAFGRVTPNPTRAGATFALTLPSPGPVVLEIVDTSGRMIATRREHMAGGQSELRWDGRDDRGARVSAGVYVAKLNAAGQTRKAKLTVLR
jgi:YVTN family beta-propeller protein